MLDALHLEFQAVLAAPDMHELVAAQAALGEHAGDGELEVLAHRALQGARAVTEISAFFYFQP